MDIPSLLAKIAGFVLFGWTAFSAYKHVRSKYFVVTADSATTHQSISETFLNNLLLYVWHAFMVAFSIGLIINN